MTAHHITVTCACGHRFSDRHDCDHLASPPSAIAALQAERDALRAKVQRVEAALRAPNGEREWHNQGRSGFTPVVDVSTIRRALRGES